jgi:hypothetical protein
MKFRIFDNLIFPRIKIRIIIINRAGIIDRFLIWIIRLVRSFFFIRV